MADVGERTGADAAARRFLKRRLVIDVVTLVVGGLLLATGIAGFAYLAHRSDHLASTGVLATATAVEVDNFNHRFQQDEHVVVAFRVDGVVYTARCYIASNDQFAVGQPVAIRYDPDDPTVAQLAGTPDLGPGATPFLGFAVLGLLVVAPGCYGVVVRRGIGAALAGPDRPMTVARFARRGLLLRRPDDPLDGLEVRVRGQVRRFSLEEDAAVRVFGTGEPKTALVLVDRETGAVVFGRIDTT